MGDDYRMYWNLEIANHTLDTDGHEQGFSKGDRS
jgi:hypothetical protein